MISVRSFGKEVVRHLGVFKSAKVNPHHSKNLNRVRSISSRQTSQPSIARHGATRSRVMRGASQHPLSELLEQLTLGGEQPIRSFTEGGGRNSSYLEKEHFEAYLDSSHNQISSQVMPDYSLKGGWRKYWKGFPVGQGQARRHIVMAHHIRLAMMAVRANAYETGKVEALKTVASEFLQGRGVEFEGSASLETLLTDVYKELHNLRFNVFIGDGNWNALIGVQATRLEKAEPAILQKIESANDRLTLIHALKDWFENSVKIKDRKDRDFNPAEAQLQDQFKQAYHAALERFQVAFTVDQCKEVCRDIVHSLRDSVSNDLSDASDARVAQWQNRFLIPWHFDVMTLETKPSVERFACLLESVDELDAEFESLLSQHVRSSAGEGQSKEVVKALTQSTL